MTKTNWMNCGVFILLAAMGSAQVTPPPTRNVVSKDADIHLDVEATRLFEPIVLTIHFRNKSPANMVVVETALERNYTIEVFDEDGKPVELTERGKTLQGPGMTLKNDAITLKPGEVAPDTSVDLNSLYRFTRGGTYHVSVARRIWTDPTIIERAFSGKLAFTVVP